MNKIHEWINTGLILLVLVIALVGGNQSAVGGGTRFQNGLSADGTSPATGEVRGTTLTITGATSITGAATISGLTTMNAGQLRSYTTASSSVSTATLSQADILNYDTLLYTPGGAAATKTLTLPATSTLTSMVPTAGDMQKTCIYNATSTAASTLTLAAGTGIDLESATSTLVISARGSGCLTFIRETDTDVTVLFNGYVNAD